MSQRSILFLIVAAVVVWVLAGKSGKDKTKLPEDVGGGAAHGFGSMGAAFLGK